MTRQELVWKLDELADPSLVKYNNTVVSDTRYPMRYIRMPVLRDMARQAAKGDWHSLLEPLEFRSYEELMVVGLAIAYAKEPFGDKLTDIRKLLPLLDSWALTDSIVPTFKIKDVERDAAWGFALECLESEQEYTVRFGIIMLLDYFLTAEKIPEVAAILTCIRDRRYYVRMAVAWCFAEMAVYDYHRVEQVLTKGQLDLFVHNMTIRKMRESYRICPERKAAVAALRRKEEKK